MLITTQKAITGRQAGDCCPELIESDNPVQCNECGEIWDADEQHENYIRGFDGEYYCVRNPDRQDHKCFLKGQKRSFVESLREQILPQLIRARITLAEIHKDHDDMLKDDECDPYDDLQRTIEDIELFTGKMEVDIDETI